MAATAVTDTSFNAEVIESDIPVLVDFWAPWCGNCKTMAPTLQALEKDYQGKVNFVMINGNERQAWPMIEAFGVDAIPHLALVSAQGDVETALVGIVPKHVLAADLDVLLQNAAAPPCEVSSVAALASDGVAGPSSGTLLCTESSSKKALPYQMLDTFAGRPEQRRLHFDP